MTLTLAPDLKFPDEAVTQAIGILAKRGSGKSNAGAVLAEEMHKAGLPFVVVDPVGAWWGLRSSADGKGAGLPVPIFGGYRGDVPLEPGGGALIADLIVEENLSAVLDVSAFDSETAKRRFLWTFAERLYLQKGKPEHDSPLHLFLEEADDYIPQRATGDVARCLGAFERIVKRGRARGLGCTMISQRSASLNKDVLTQIETLIVLRTTSPQDRKAIADWVKYHGQSEQILESLSSLAPGEAWVWSPWLDLTKRVQIRRRQTFDSGATPGVKAKRAVATLADVDLDAITVQMAATIERAKAEDPAELRKQVAALKKELAAAKFAEREWHDKAQDAVAKPVEVAVAHVPPAVVDVLQGIHADSETLRNGAQAFATSIAEMADELQRRTTEGLAAAEVLPTEAPRKKWVVSPAGSGGPPTRISRQLAKTSPAPTRGGTKAAGAARTDGPRTSGPAAAGDLTGPQQRVLDAIAWLNAVGFDQPTKIQVGFIAGYRVGKAVGGTFGNLLGALRSDGFIDYPAAGRVWLLDAGVAIAETPRIAPTTEALQEAVFARLSDPEQRVLQVLIDVYPVPIAKQELGARAGYTVGPAVGGTFGNILGRLRTLGLIDYPAAGQAVATPLLFLEGAA